MAVIAAPLGDEDEEDQPVSPVAGSSARLGPGEEEWTPYLGKLAAVAGLGGLLFGFDTGVVGGILVTIGTDLSPSCPSTEPTSRFEEDPPCPPPRLLTVGEEELIVSATTVGALVGSLAAGWLSDFWGRKKVIILAAVLFAFGALEQTAADNLNMMVVGRLLVGFGVGLSSMVSPLYLAELSPPSLRGRLVTLLVGLITFGQVLAYAIAALFYPVRSGWRYMSASAAIPALAQLALAPSLPESPRWLVMKGEQAKARVVLAILQPGRGLEEVEVKVQKIERAIRRENERNLAGKEDGLKEKCLTLWQTRSYRRALAIAVMLQAAQQATGFNTLMYYSQRLLASIGFPHPSAAALVIALSNCICTVLTLIFFIDRSGRRPLLLRSLSGMALGLFLIGLCFIFLPKDLSQPSTSPSFATVGVTPAAVLCVLSMIVFVSAFALGLGNVPWVVQSEIFPSPVRSIGNGLAAGTNWAVNLIVSATFLHLAKAITPTGVFWVYGVITLVALYFTWAYVPETRGLALEDISRLLESDDPVHAHDDEDVGRRRRSSSGSIALRRSSESGPGRGGYTAVSTSGEHERDDEAAAATEMEGEGGGEREPLRS